jgi:hypothetical protein
MTLAENQQVAETFLTDGAHPALGEGVGVRRLWRREHHLDALGRKHGLKGWAER